MMSPNYVILGRFGKPHGVKGFITIHSFTEPPEALTNYKDFSIQQKEQWQPITIDDIKLLGTKIIAHIQNIDTPEDVKVYTNKSIGIPRNQLPKNQKNEYYWADLIGMKVINHNQITLGIIDHLTKTHANDILVVLGEKRHLIPFLRPQIIKKIDTEHGIIHVDWDLE